MDENKKTKESRNKRIYADYINTIAPIMEKRNELYVEFSNYICDLAIGQDNPFQKIKVVKLIYTVFFYLEKYDKVTKMKAEEDKHLISFQKAKKIIYSSIDDQNKRVKELNLISIKYLFIFVRQALFTSGIDDIEVMPRDPGGMD